MLFNYHTHTKRCNHAEGEDREYVENAIKGGLKTLGFADHAPYLFPNGFQSHFRMKTDELHEYAESVRALQKEYANDIRILCGFELEYYPDFHKEEMEFLSAVKPDYLILGQHFIGDEYSSKLLANRQKEDAGLVAFVTQVLSAIATGDFLYVAHPDMAGFQYSSEVCDREYRRLCEGAKRMNIPLEFNLLGLAQNRHYPTERFFKIAAEVGNDVVLGCDAHEPNALNRPDVERLAKGILKNLGITPIEKPWL